MKKCLLGSIGLVIISMLILISYNGCASNDYTCKVADDRNLEFISEEDNGKIVFIELGDTTYEAQYHSSRQSSLTNEIIDVYGVVDKSSNLIISRIRMNSDTGQVVGFTNISPYPIIEDIDGMSDTELREIVESMVSDLAGFSQYNEFRVSRPQSANSSYYLLWQVKRDLPCNIKVEIYITADGLIKSFSMTDACPPICQVRLSVMPIAIIYWKKKYVTIWA